MLWGQLGTEQAVAHDHDFLVSQPHTHPLPHTSPRSPMPPSPTPAPPKHTIECRQCKATRLGGWQVVAGLSEARVVPYYLLGLSQLTPPHHGECLPSTQLDQHACIAAGTTHPVPAGAVPCVELCLVGCSHAWLGPRQAQRTGSHQIVLIVSHLPPSLPPSLSNHRTPHTHPTTHTTMRVLTFATVCMASASAFHISMMATPASGPRFHKEVRSHLV